MNAWFDLFFHDYFKNYKNANMPSVLLNFLDFKIPIDSIDSSIRHTGHTLLERKLEFHIIFLLSRIAFLFTERRVSTVLYILVK
jgi:hypothetical protein